MKNKLAHDRRDLESVICVLLLTAAKLNVFIVLKILLIIISTDAINWGLNLHTIK